MKCCYSLRVNEGFWCHQTNQWHRMVFWRIWVVLSILCTDSNNLQPRSSPCIPPQTPQWSPLPDEWYKCERSNTNLMMQLQSNFLLFIDFVNTFWSHSVKHMNERQLLHNLMLIKMNQQLIDNCMSLLFTHKLPPLVYRDIELSNEANITIQKLKTEQWFIYRLFKNIIELQTKS